MATQSFTVTLANGKTRKVNPTKDWRKDKPSAAQIRKISTLCYEQSLKMADLPNVKTKGGASDLIKKLMKQGSASA